MGLSYQENIVVFEHAKNYNKSGTLYAQEFFDNARNAKTGFVFF